MIYDTLSLPSFPTPVFSTIRDWLLKLELSKLTKPCEPEKTAPGSAKELYIAICAMKGLLSALFGSKVTSRIYKKKTNL